MSRIRRFRNWSGLFRRRTRWGRETDTSGGLTNGVNGNTVGVDVNTVLDTALKDNGGPTPTHALQAGSPAIDAGIDVDPVEMSDQRGAPFLRTIDDPAIANATGGDGTDIGA